MSVKDRIHELKHVVDIEPDIKLSKVKTNEDRLEKVLADSEIVRRWIEAIEENTQICEGILNNAMINHSKDYQPRIETTFKNTETIAFNVSKKLKQMSENLKKCSFKGTAEYRMRLTQYNGNHVRFKQVMERHQDLIQRHRDIIKDLLLKCTSIVNDKPLNDEEIERLISDNRTQIFAKNHLMEEYEARQQLQEIEERHKELKKIENHLEEVRNLFVQMAMLVEEQQEIINRIEYHVTEAGEYVEQGEEKLEAALNYKRKSNKKMMYLAIIIIVVILILLLIIF